MTLDFQLPDTRHEPIDEDEIWDGYDLTEWFAAQEWSDGNVGMIGGSGLGVTQHLRSRA